LTFKSFFDKINKARKVKMSSISSSTSPNYGDYSNCEWMYAPKTEQDEWNAVGQTMGDLNQEQEKVNKQTQTVNNM
jgi:hypothetical protein